MRLRRFIFLSIFFHAGIFLALKEFKTPPPPPPKIEVTFKEIPKGNPQSHGGKSKKSGKGKRSSKGKGLKLSQLAPKMDSLFEPGPNAGRLIDEDARGTSEWPAGSWGAHQGGLLKELEIYIPLERIFQEIEGLLQYPGILGQNGISGTLNVRLRFTDESKCDWSRTTISESNHYLKYYIASLLKKLCRLDAIEHLRLKSDQFADINFNFVIGDGFPKPGDDTGDAIVGNVLLFKRIFIKPLGSYQIGPIHGSVFVPLAFTVDVMWFMEKWEEIMNNYDPLAEFRDK